MKQRVFVHLCLVIYVITSCFLRQSWGDDYFCNNEIVHHDSNTRIGRSLCYQVSQKAVTWHEAHRFCHERQGWLANDFQSDSTVRWSVLIDNDIRTIWTGYHVSDHRLLTDAFPTVQPTNSVSIQNQASWNKTVSPSRCVVGACQNQREQPGEPGFDFQPCSRQQYVNQFVPCGEKHFFICYFSGVNVTEPKNNRVESPIQMYGYDYLPVQLYLTTEKTTHNESDQACGRLLKGGTTFRESSRVPMDILNIIGKQNKGQDFVTFRWVHHDDDLCYAVRWSGSFTARKHYTMTTWPCDSKLLAICQRDRVYPSETKITATFTFQDDRLALVGNEIQGTARFLREHIANEVPENVKGITLDCSLGSVGSLKQGQSVSVFKSGIPIQRFSSLTTRNGIQLTSRQFKMEEEREDIDLLQSFYCQVNTEEDNTLITSNQIFLRPTDITVYSLHIELFSNASRTMLWDYYASSLANTLTALKRGIKESGNKLYSFIFNRWQTRPLLFLPGDEKQNSTLVMYLWTFVQLENEEFNDGPPIDVGPDFNEESTNARQKRQADENPDEGQIPTTQSATQSTSQSSPSDVNEQRVIEDLQLTIREFQSFEPNGYLPFDIKSVRVLSIDWCWPKSVYDNATQRSYALPKTSGGTVFESDETCAQDGRPLVTVECQGDKVIGFEWGPVQSNPLCDYSVVTDGDASNVTNSLMSISQENINATNVDSYLNETKVLTTKLTDETVNTKDILYLADILQKSSTLPISPEAAQDFLDTVDIATSLKTSPLTEAQEISKASNRILQSIDNLGGRVSIDDNSERIISGQYALEVWNLTLDYEQYPIVGLKVLSDRESTIDDSDMVSLFSEDAMEYDKTQTGIILPKAFIMSVLGNSSSEDIKLSLNIYRDTTLYSTVKSRSNATLNSKVIAAQLLVNGRQITDISPYKVITVFEPSRQVEDDEIRQARTVCAYWDYTAYEGAGSWATDGCDYERTESGRDVCICDHLTNFAVLLDFYGEQDGDEDHKLALSIITIIGLSLSIFGLSVSILSFLCIKKLRQGRPQQTLFNLALALLLSWIVLLAGLERTENRAGCIAVAAILHYLIMASFMWMLMEAILQYLLFVRVMNTYFSKYMLKTGIPAWGLPIIPVIIVFAIDPDLYRGRDDYCWMSLDAFYYAFALPVGLIVLTNLVIFILVVVSLCRRKDMTKSSTSSQSHTAVNLRASFICFFVLGMSWVFGFLTIEKARTVFQYIFCITSTLQGFIIFIMMTARDKNVRQFWKNFCCRCCKTDPKGSAYRTSNDKRTGDSSQTSRQIPRLQKDKGGAYHGSHSSSSSDQVTSSTNMSSLTDGGKGDSGYDQPVHYEANRSEEISCDYESFAT